MQNLGVRRLVQRSQDAQKESGDFSKSGMSDGRRDARANALFTAKARRDERLSRRGEASRRHLRREGRRAQRPRLASLFPPDRCVSIGRAMPTTTTAAAAVSRRFPVLLLPAVRCSSSVDAPIGRCSRVTVPRLFARERDVASTCNVRRQRRRVFFCPLARRLARGRRQRQRDGV